VSEDASRTEAVQAGLFHEQTETAETGQHHKHVTAEELAPDHLAQQANSDIEVGQPPTRQALLLAAGVAIVVLAVVVAVAVALHS
jgi:hypothetical protein